MPSLVMVSAINILPRLTPHPIVVVAGIAATTTAAKLAAAGPIPAPMVWGRNGHDDSGRGDEEQETDGGKLGEHSVCIGIASREYERESARGMLCVREREEKMSRGAGKCV